MIELRPHHIERIIELKQRGSLYRGFFSMLVKAFYGNQVHADYMEVLQRVESGEEISVTKGTDNICLNCPYRKNCIKGDYKKANKQIPLMLRTIGVSLLNPQNEDDGAMQNLGLDENKKYTLDSLINK